MEKENKFQFEDKCIFKRKRQTEEEEEGNVMLMLLLSDPF